MDHEPLTGFTASAVASKSIDGKREFSLSPWLEFHSPFSFNGGWEWRGGRRRLGRAGQGREKYVSVSWTISQQDRSLKPVAREGGYS